MGLTTIRAWSSIMETSSIRNDEACGEKNTVCGEDVNRENAGESLSIPSVPRFPDISKLEPQFPDNDLAFGCRSTVTALGKERDKIILTLILLGCYGITISSRRNREEKNEKKDASTCAV